MIKKKEKDFQQLEFLKFIWNCASESRNFGLKRKHLILNCFIKLGSGQGQVFLQYLQT